jgi:hypothetical protein
MRRPYCHPNQNAPALPNLLLAIVYVILLTLDTTICTMCLIAAQTQTSALGGFYTNNILVCVK